MPNRDADLQLLAEIPDVTHCIPDRDGAGFLAVFSDSKRKTCSLGRIGPPWSAPVPTCIELSSSVEKIWPSASGRYLAVSHFAATLGESEDSFEEFDEDEFDEDAANAWVEVWDVDAGKRLLGLPKVPNRGMVQWAGFHPDEKALIWFTIVHVFVTSLETLDTSRRYQAPRGSGGAALHPQGTTLVFNSLATLDLTTGKQTKPLRVGQSRGSGEVMAKQLEAMLEGSKGPVAAMYRGIGQFMAARSATSGLIGSETVELLSFHPDGTLLMCVTNRGVRAYAWDAILSATEDAPPPVFAADPEPVPTESALGAAAPPMVFLYTLAHDAVGNRVFYAGLTGEVGFLNLETGESGTFLEVPGNPLIRQLAMSKDGSALACVCHDEMVPRPRVTLRIWQVRSA